MVTLRNSKLTAMFSRKTKDSLCLPHRATIHSLSPKQKQRWFGSFQKFLMLVTLLQVVAWMAFWKSSHSQQRQQEDPISHRRQPDDPPIVWQQAEVTELSRKEKHDKEVKKAQFDAIQAQHTLTPCQWNKDCAVTATSSFFSSKKQQLLVRNSLDVDRHWCGFVIPANGGLLEIPSEQVADCIQEPPSVYLPLDNNNPIKVSFNDPHATMPTKPVECNIPCQIGGYPELLSRVFIQGTPWQFLWSMEGPDYYSETKVKPKAWKKDHYYATTSFQSDVPLPYYSAAEYQIQSPAVPFDTAIPGASFLANNCYTFSKREDLVETLMTTTRLRVDSLSSCRHNKDPSFDMNNKTQVLQHYLFHLAFENQRQDDYITEKLWGTLQAGTIPIYYGARNVKEHGLPEKSVIHVDDYESPLALANYLIQVSQDKSLYDSYHTWRKESLPLAFEERYNFTKTHSHCRVCRWAYSKKYGLGWNHAQQTVQDTKTERSTCRNKKGLLGRPVKEYWYRMDETSMVPANVNSAVEDKTCTMDDSNRRLSIDDNQWQRSVYTQDGVTDMYLVPSTTNNNNNNVYVLKLQSPISDNFTTVDKGHWWLQDDHSRLTLLTSKDVAVSMTPEGMLEIPVSAAMQLRIIVEDIDTFHQGAHEKGNYFGKLLTRDFFKPLQIYRMS